MTQKRFSNNLVLGLNFVAAFVLLLVYLSPYTNPANYWYMGYIAYLYPVFFLVNICFMLYWLVKKNILLGLSLFMLVVGYRHFTRAFGFQFSQIDIQANNFKLVSYDVKNFEACNFISDSSKDKLFKNYFSDQEPDLICFQNLFDVKSKYGYAYLDTLRQLLDINYIYTDTAKSKVFNNPSGIKILSKYPILKSARIDLEEEFNSNYDCVFLDLEFPDKIIRLYAICLQSLYSDHQEHFDEVFDLRIRQYKSLKAHIKESPYPVIIAGNYNEPPLSYLNAKITQDLKLKDAALEAGFGWQASLNSNILKARIDYIHVDSSFECHQFEVDDIDLSFHLPLSVCISYQ